ACLAVLGIVGARLQATPRAPRLIAWISGTESEWAQPPRNALAATRVRTETTIRDLGGALFQRTSNGSADVVELESGAAECSWRPLGTGERFLVRTRDAEVEVRGTVFRVAAAQGRIERVEVSEGVVEVRHDGASQTIRAGESWTPAERTVAGGASASS